ncbi:hypothetical protein N9U70_00070 [Paracoccaceae bacterium]|nr:hypothetical protein [Paracoccaceae bacterium]
MLTKKQHELLLFLDERITQSGVTPSFEEMKNKVGLKSKSGIHRLISALEDRGFIRKLPFKARAIEILKSPNISSKASDKKDDTLDKHIVELPVVGRIAAGLPYSMIIGMRPVLSGVNLVGLKRRGSKKENIKKLVEVFSKIFDKKGSQNFQDRIKALDDDLITEITEVQKVLEFIKKESTRSFVAPKS